MDSIDKIFIFSCFTISLIVVIIIFSWIWRRHRMILRNIVKPMFNITHINTEEDKKEIMKKFNKTLEVKPFLASASIAVMISSYRDSELCITLKDLFEKSLFPERLFIKIVEQNDVEDHRNCFSENADIDKELKKHIKVYKMNYKDAKGPTHARSICETLWDGEEYHMMIDSHMRFEPGWDLLLLDMLYKCPNPKRTVITSYPEGYKREERHGKVYYTIIMRKGWRTHRWKWTKEYPVNGVPQFESITQLSVPPEIPPLTGFWGACFHFSHSDTLRLVPFSPKTPHLFFGEEAFMAARYYTHGFELRAPCFSVVYHLWQRNYRPVFFTHQNQKLKNESVKLVMDIMTGKLIDEKYGLGNEKTWRDYWDYVGLDPFERKPTRPFNPWRPKE